MTYSLVSVKRQIADDGAAREHCPLSARHRWATLDTRRPAGDVMTDQDEQDIAEMYDEESRGEDETIAEIEPLYGRVRGKLLAPDGGGVDDVGELVATELEDDGDRSPEESALHLEDH